MTSPCRIELALDQIRDGFNHEIHIRVAHGRKDGKRQNVLVGSFCSRALALADAKVLLIVGMQIQGDVMDVDANTFIPKGGK